MPVTGTADYFKNHPQRSSACVPYLCRRKGKRHPSQTPLGSTAGLQLEPIIVCIFMGTGKCSRLYQTDVSMRDLEDGGEQWKVRRVRGSGIVRQIQRRRPLLCGIRSRARPLRSRQHPTRVLGSGAARFLLERSRCVLGVSSGCLFLPVSCPGPVPWCSWKFHVTLLMLTGWAVLVAAEALASPWFPGDEGTGGRPSSWFTAFSCPCCFQMTR